MKKFLFIALCAMSLSACADDSKVITFEELPATAQTLLLQYIQAQDIMIVTQEGIGFWADYDVVTTDQSQWSFESDGSLESVRVFTGVPSALVPASVQVTVDKMYPDAIIVKYSIDKDDREQDVELNNRIELTFTLNGVLKEVDVD